MMRIIILGASGMLGGYVSSYLRKIYAERSDILILTPKRDQFDVVGCLYRHPNFPPDLRHGDVLINCAGMINKRDDKIAEGGESLFLRESIIVNSIFPQMMALHCISNSIRFIHISTDCVYDGVKGNYDIHDKHTATDVYGISKSCGEPNSSKCILIRTSIIGESKNGRSLLEWLRSKRGEVVVGYDNHKWNGVTCLELAKHIYTILESGKKNGLFTITSPHPVTKYELCKKISDAYGWDINIVKGGCEKNVDRTMVGDTVSTKNIDEQLRELVEYSL